jgi:SET domain-containing protein
MFLVKTRLGLSSIQGIGVFADEFIPKGTVVWEFHEGVDRTIDQDTLSELPEPARRDAERLSWPDPELGVRVLCSGHGPFINHSRTPCLLHAASVSAKTIAARDIQPGEELTEEYVDAPWEVEENKHG